MKKFLSIILVAMLCGIAYSASAQNRTITGTVVDEDDQPLPGASVVEVGSTNGTVTDIDGRFTLNVKNGATIVVAYVGYNPYQFTISGASNYYIKLTTSKHKEEPEDGDKDK
jgi:hypothetical protein